ncbi:efflux RND transporter periplasmic adaptor subunit [Magnetospirillum gryphiswaldense]|uniref:HlyD family secretion protein n=2 Tax=Magnetospirillum gryphiswaldense TaxID=55518 RepID=V6F822_MAGGM|nr:efflux RND transporter periplasmic adaptor subunit [Magnetospirillum gryphiswaldense]AVM74423.1 multidrug resistance protein MdtN [Magnetospirillum gryphiswaldense MSR-1]AVM75444.1 multidrug resistance protein MdtN [Magnetospirillum gryphiswaldense MSR-1]AVM78326.1 multidrug resistance protein MdtN [Magnetospirillum gryphiswaldense]AVM79347.1 multidrug resistance protein MdtN [Magnetospirillum gryphiswaldense]CAM75346.1 Membrane-fusion protein [Magnetospirillum gryphiswaldense MSR-1]
MTGWWRILPLLFGLAAPAAAQDLRAQLSPRDFTTLAAEIGAKVEKVGAREGERFKRGDTLIAFDCSIQRAQMAEARAALGATEKTVAVNTRLLELQTIGKLESDVAQAERDKARAKVDASGAVLGKCTVPAPFDGRVVEQKVRAQQYVQPGQALLDILDDSVLELDFIVPSKWLVWLKPGHLFQVAMDETARTYPVKLTRIGARIDPVSQSVKVTGAIGGHFPELAAGMSGKVLLSPPP